METVTVTYSHPAPFIRERYCYHLAAAVTANTARSRGEHRAAADAYRNALDIVMSSPVGADQPCGMPHGDTMPIGDLTRMWHDLGADDFARLMGAATPGAFREASK